MPEDRTQSYVEMENRLRKEVVEEQLPKVAFATPGNGDTPMDKIREGYAESYRKAAEPFAEIFDRISKDADRNRVTVITGLLNLFNLAILKQAGRKAWNEDDTQRFIYAMQEIDGIGRAAQNVALEDYKPK